MRISASCYAVLGLGYSPPWCVNAGFVAGSERTLVIDTGGNAYAGQTIAGYAAAVNPANQIVVINTEKHFDHIGGNRVFRDRGCEIWGHPAVARTPEEFQSEHEEFNATIPNRARRAAQEERAFFHGTELTNPTHPVSDNAQFDLGGGCLAQVVFTPGHTRTNLSIWIPDEKVLFTGDCLISEYLPNLDAGTTEDWRTWLQSLDRVEALGAHIAIPGHGPPARDPKAVTRMIEEVRRVLLESIARGSSPTA